MNIPPGDVQADEPIGQVPKLEVSAEGEAHPRLEAEDLDAVATLHVGSKKVVKRQAAWAILQMEERHGITITSTLAPIPGRHISRFVASKQ